MTQISLAQLALDICQRATEIEDALGYLGRVGRPLPGAPVGTPTSPPPKSTTDPRVQPYFIVWPGGGAPTSEDDLATQGDDLIVSIRITAAGGDALDTLALADRIHDQFHRWEPPAQSDDVVCGPLAVPTGYYPDLQTDPSVQPERLFVPLQYRLIVHT